MIKHHVEITIITVNFNTSEFIKLMLFALKALTKNQFKVIICDNGSNANQLLTLIKTVQQYDNIELLFRQQSTSGSIAHAEALDILIKKVQTKYTVIMDSDCTFLLNYWDEFLIKQINETTKIIGSSSPLKRKGKRIGGGDFPLPFAVFFETCIYKKLNISCMPGDFSKGQDTCWEWRSKFTNNGYKGKVFITHNTRDFKYGPFEDLTGIEEYYLKPEMLIASHFGRGATGGGAKYFKNFKIPFFSKYLKKLYGRYERNKWIKKCYEIINKNSIK